MTREEFYKVFIATEKNATDFIPEIVKGHNYVVNYCGGGVYTRHMWDGDTGEIYKWQVIVHIAPDMLLINEASILDGDKVYVWSTNNTDLIER